MADANAARDGWRSETQPHQDEDFHPTYEVETEKEDEEGGGLEPEMRQ